MLETVIVGGGLCGVALAASLQTQGRSFAVYEARSRIGGRILSELSEKTGMRVDLGPTWYWPETQPGMARLVADLGLVTFLQLDTGTNLRLVDHDRRPTRSEGEDVHAGARRIEGGVYSIIEALLKKVPAERFHLEHVLTSVLDRGDHVELRFTQGDAIVTVEARRVVLAVPPRLLEERVVFEPELDEQRLEEMRATYTWMAAEAKGVIAYDKPVWREAGESGNAFVTHGQAVFGQIWDSCDATGTRAALAGFLALPAALRQSFKAGLPMLMGNQMMQVFGPELEKGEQHFQDWAAEPFTCSRLDTAPPGEHPEYSTPFLRQPAWEGKLFFGSSETANYNGGYMEGALDAARRLARDIACFAPLASDTAMSGTATNDNEAPTNGASVSAFVQWMVEQQTGVLEVYRRHLNKLMASADKEQVTQRAMLATMEQVFSGALLQLETLPFDMRGVPVEKGRSALTPEILNSFNGFIQHLLDEVIQYNRTSCALSNFPGEDKLSKDYLQAILADIAAAWREFCISVNSLLLSKMPVSAAS